MAELPEEFLKFWSVPRRGDAPTYTAFLSGPSVSARQTAGVRVLIIEDDRSMAASLEACLQAEGYLVDVVRDGEEGLWWATEYDFDAVVLDMVLPRLSGLLVVKGLRDVGRMVPVLMLSTKEGGREQTEALDMGADDYLTTPLSYPILLARLRALIRRGSKR